MSSVKAFTDDIAFEAKIASFYELNEHTQKDLILSVSALLEQKGKEHGFLVWRVQLKGQKREIEQTKDEIIKLAQEAGLCELRNGFADWIDAGPSLHEMTLFASLVAEQEREKCARVCEKTSSDMNPMAHWAANECARLIRGMKTE